MSLYQHFGFAVALIVAGVVMIRLTRPPCPSWVRWVNGASLVSNSIVALFYGVVIADNAIGGCYPWSPAEVEYHEGMTLCPGQTTLIKIEVTP